MENILKGSNCIKVKNRQSYSMLWQTKTNMATDSLQLLLSRGGVYSPPLNLGWP